MGLQGAEGVGVPTSVIKTFVVLLVNDDEFTTSGGGGLEWTPCRATLELNFFRAKPPVDR